MSFVVVVVESECEVIRKKKVNANRECITDVLRTCVWLFAQWGVGVRLHNISRRRSLTVI